MDITKWNKLEVISAKMFVNNYKESLDRKSIRLHIVFMDEGIKKQVHYQYHPDVKT